MEKGRIEFIDLAKGFCIILVVFNHVHKFYDPPYLLDDTFKVFRMPLYFFLSGLFFKSYEGFIGFLKRKINKLLIPFIFFFIATSFLLRNIMLYVLNFKLKLNILWSFIYPEFFPNFPIWFLLCLFELNIIFYCIYIVSNKFGKHKLIVLTILSGVIGFTGYYLGHTGLNLPMFIDTAMSALPFFYVGFLTRKYTTLLLPNRLDRYNIPIACVLFLITYLFATRLNYASNDLTNASLLTVYGCGLTGIFSVLLLSKAINRLPFISYVGRYSIMLLCTHYIIAYFLFLFQSKYFELPTWTAIFINLAITLSLYVILIPFMRKYLPHVTAQKDVIKV